MQYENLWAPWRMSYIQQVVDDGQAKELNAMQTERCFLCEAAKMVSGSEDARQARVLLSDHRGVILLNLYPYTNGHLLVAPLDHLADLTDMSAAGRADLMELTVLAERLVRMASNPQGFNVGINLGRCAGAGLPGHVHVHVVPRWSGDTNYMQTVGRVRVIPEALDGSYARLIEAMEKMK